MAIDYRDFKLGELNELIPNPEDLLHLAGTSPLTLLKQALGKVLERTSTFNDKGIMRAEVLLSAVVP